MARGPARAALDIREWVERIDNPRGLAELVLA
jgi:hypothetical protein